jgi:ergothioneine biosynthesis protein EgtB
MHHCRQGTLAVLDGLSELHLRSQIHPEFSPLGWHLGHIALTEAYWLLGQCGGQPLPRPEYRQLLIADGLPKTARENLPPWEVLLDYVTDIRQRVFEYLAIAPVDQQERLWRWVLQHESQHSETMSFLQQLQQGTRSPLVREGEEKTTLIAPEMVEIPAGEFVQGSDQIDALDNERPQHCLPLPTYWIDRYPVTQGQYTEFIHSGGYQNARWWSTDGWAWRSSQGVTQPLYWLGEIPPAQYSNYPVCGVSAHEAEAYSRFVGKRLPTETEWEKAAAWHPQFQQSQPYPWGQAWPTAQYCNHNRDRGHPTPVNTYPEGQSAYGCYDCLGNVWEWTATWFAPYPQFESYPYPGYSAAYFDHQHRVLRGGSWATRPWALRNSLRNWYHPEVRQILAGFRCVSSEKRGG